MFDIGFAELVLVGVVGLLVIGPERLPGAIRTGSLWLNRIKRGFNDIKREVQQELHNDEVMQQLRKTGQQLKTEADSLGRSLDSIDNTLKKTGAELNKPALGESSAGDVPPPATDTRAE